MKIRRILLLALCAMLLFGLVSFGASAAYKSERIYDFKDLLSNEEELDAVLVDFEQKTGLKIRVITTYDEYFSIGNIGLNSSDDAVVLEIIKDGGIYYYEFYTYGEASVRILDSEVDRILDSADVYDNLKSGNFNKGIKAFLDLTQRAYIGNLQEPIWKTVVISFIIAFIIGGIVVACVVVKYKRKLKAPSYPLDKYAKLSLDPFARRDEFMGSRIIKTRVNTSSGGSGGSGGRRVGGGGSRGRR